MAGKILSVEIGLSATKMCLTDYKTKNPKVYKYAKLPTPQGVISDGEVQATEEFVELLKETISQNKMSAKQVVFTVTSSKIASREITIPFVKEKKIDALIRANAPDYFPIDLSQYELGYILLGKTTDATPQYKVLLLAAPKTLVSSYQQLAGACGMQLVALDYSGNSVYQMVKNDCKSGVQMVIKIDEQTSIFTVLKDQAIVLQRNIAYGINDALNTIMENRIFQAGNYDEALELATRKTCIRLSLEAGNILDADEESEEGEDSEQWLTAKQSVTSSFGMLINGIGRIIDYYVSRNGGEGIDMIYITGLGSEFSGLTKLLTNELGIKTKGLKNLGGFNLERSFKDGRYGEYITCIGAAISPIGFVGEEKKGSTSKENDYASLAWILLTGGLLITIALIGTCTLSLWKQKQEHAQNVATVNSLAEIQTVYDQYVAAQNANADAKTLYAYTETHNENLLAFIDEMEEKMPTDIQVTSFTSGLDNVTMNIEVDSKEEMANAVQQLRSFQSLSTISVLGAQDETDENGIRTVSFSVNCVYKTAEELAAEAEASQNN